MGCSPSTNRLNQIEPLLRVSVNSPLPDQNPAEIISPSKNKKCSFRNNNVAKKNNPSDTEILENVAMNLAESPGNMIPVGKVLPVLASPFLLNKKTFKNKFLESRSESQDEWTNRGKLHKKMLETDEIDYLRGSPKILPLVRSPNLPVLLAGKNTPLLPINFGKSITDRPSCRGTRKKSDDSHPLENLFHPSIKSSDSSKSFQDKIHRTDDGILTLGKFQPSLIYK